MTFALLRFSVPVFRSSLTPQLVEERFGVAPLGERDAKANDMRGSFDFTQHGK